MPSRQMWWWLSSLQVCMSSRHKWKCNLPILLQCNKSRHNPRGLCHDNCNLVRLAWIESGLWAVNGVAVKLWYAVQSCPQSFELWWHSDKRDGDCRHLKKKGKEWTALRSCSRKCANNLSILLQRQKTKTQPSPNVWRLWKICNSVVIWPGCILIVDDCANQTKFSRIVAKTTSILTSAAK